MTADHRRIRVRSRVGPVGGALLMLAALVAQPARAQTGLGDRRADTATVPVRRSAYDPGYLIAEAAAGAACAVGASLILMRAGAATIGPHGGEDPGMLGAMIGFSVGLWAGSAAGVHVVARHAGLPARYWDALAGSVSATLALGLLHLDPDEPTAWLLVYAVPTIGAVVTSSVASATRMRPVVRPALGGVDVGLELAF